MDKDIDICANCFWFKALEMYDSKYPDACSMRPEDLI